MLSKATTFQLAHALTEIALPMNVPAQQLQATM
jgi:hypothetical protein